MKYEKDFELIHPETGECVGIFECYEDGHEIWWTGSNYETVTFEGFLPDGWAQWSCSADDFAKGVDKKVTIN